jgi:hypothetical protein
VKFKGSKQTATEPDAVTPALPFDLSEVPLSALWIELRTRGFEALPIGAWEDVVTRLEYRVKEAEAAFLRAAPPRDLMERLGYLAGTALPETANRAIELMGENSELRTRAVRAEKDASALAGEVPAAPPADISDNNDN